MPDRSTISRRTALGLLAAPLIRPALRIQPQSIITKPIPSTGEALPVIGIGSWITFNVGNDREARNACTEVMRNFFELGGKMIDSSPMYGSAQEVIGYGLNRLGNPDALFSADKVWITSTARGASQIENSRELWGVPQFDLMQVHNLRSWEGHLETLHAMKASGSLRYVGITTSEGRRHSLFEEVMQTQPLDFIQVSYNILNRRVEERILPIAQERGIAVIINRPFQQGNLIRRMKRQRLPDWASEAGATNWAEFLLKFIVSHPAVTCAIPATSQVRHVKENMAAATGELPTEAMRQRMIDYVEAL
ncbi:MAG: aldo/keto reductase [Rhodothermaceae bacterium]|nr:aldo/keto reductase [Rhodothermaceae bacterium]